MDDRLVGHVWYDRAVRDPTNSTAASVMAKLRTAAAPPRDRTLLALMLGMGLRPAQVAALDRDCVALESPGTMSLRLSATPSGAMRTASLPLVVAQLLRDYLATLQTDGGHGGPLFFAASHHGAAVRRLSARAVACLARRCARTCGIEFLSPLEGLPLVTPPLVGARLHAHAGRH
jgi:integrase